MLYKDIFIEIIKYLNCEDIKSIRLLNKEIKEIIDNIYFYNLYFDIITVEYNKNKIIKIYNVSSIEELNEYINIKYVEFNYYFDEPIDKLPQSITHLTFYQFSNFNQSVDKLPQSITHLTFGELFNQSVDNLPQSITHLTFGSFFNQSVDNLPKSITHITFGDYFNQSVDKLPQSITHIEFSKYSKFNQSIDKLPQTITHLTFGYHFNQSIYKLLSQSVTHLTFGHDFNKSVDNLPQSITHLTFGYNFNQKIDFEKIPKLEELTINKDSKYYKYRDKYIDTIPKKIRVIYL